MITFTRLQQGLVNNWQNNSFNYKQKMHFEMEDIKKIDSYIIKHIIPSWAVKIRTSYK